MLYYFVKYICKVGFRINFRKVFFHYQEKIPEDTAIIIAANHPTAFLDPVMLGTYLKRPTHFIVRGDIFKGKLILAILRGLKMLPIFRFRDGYANLKNNQTTMDVVYQKLAERKCVMVLAEGETKHEKRMRPIQKGTARMAFGAVEAKGTIDIQIFPTGVNYTDSHAFRSYTMIEVGKPIHLKDYMEVYQENPRKAIKMLTAEIEKQMRKLVIHIEKEADDIWINRILEINRNDFKFPIFPIKTTDPGLWKAEYEMVEKLNNFSEAQKLNTQEKLSTYNNQLKKANVSDEGIARSKAFSFINTTLLILGFLPFVAGLILNYLPMLLASNTAKRKVKKIEFYSSVRFGAGLVGYIIYWLFLLTVSLIIGNIWGIGLVLLIPFLGYFVLVYREIFERWNQARKFQKRSKDERASLLALRTAVLNSTH